MSPYNAYSSSLSSSRLSSYTPSTKYSGSTGYSSLSNISSYKYKPPAYSSTLSSKYRSPSTYTSYVSPRTYTSSTLTRNFSSSYLSTRAPKFNSVSSYENAITKSNDWKSSSDTTTERLWRSPSLSLSRRNSSSSLATLPRTVDRSPRPSLPAYTTLANTSTAGPSGYSRGSWNNIPVERPKRIGLVNLGNTCYMNSVLQCLMSTKCFMDYFMSSECLRDINPSSTTRGELIKAFLEFLKHMQDKRNFYFSPDEFRGAVRRYVPRFDVEGQQDAQEFLRCFLQALHDELNRARQRFSYRAYEPPRDTATAWRRFKEIDDSPIMDMFAGILKSTLRCTSCHHESITFDPFLDISVPLPEVVRGCSLRECIKLFTSPEILDGMNKPFCDICKGKKTASKKMEISRFPKVLVIHFKRFGNNHNIGHKLEHVIEYPLNLESGSDFGNNIDNQWGSSISYYLCGVVDHNGPSVHSGHYKAKVLDLDSKEWFACNDNKVARLLSVVGSPCSYMIFYAQAH